MKVVDMLTAAELTHVCGGTDWRSIGRSVVEGTAIGAVLGATGGATVGAFGAGVGALPGAVGGFLIGGATGATMGLVDAWTEQKWVEPARSADRAARRR